MQALFGGLLSNQGVAINNESIIEPLSLGYRAGHRSQRTLFGPTRAFVEGGYQGWFSGETPNLWRWRLGLGSIFGNSSRSNSSRQPSLDAATEPTAQPLIIGDIQTIIDTRVPEYIPNYLSESLPAIAAHAELCRCAPAGPFTMQFGQFSNMEQAVRALEFRGLRQFFNSKAYLDYPLPVFLTQTEPNQAVSLYLEKFLPWRRLGFLRRELRKNGLQVQFRRHK